MINTEKKIWNYDEYYKIKDNKQYEIVRGELIMVPAPNLDHQEISREIEFKIYNHINSLGLGKIFDAPIDMILDDKIILQPDLVFVSKDNFKILKKRGIFGVPQLTIEIISKSSVKMDRHEKYKIYESYGVEEYWIVDPLNKTIEVFKLENKKYELFCFVDEENNILSSSILEGLVIDSKEIFIFNNEE